MYRAPRNYVPRITQLGLWCRIWTELLALRATDYPVEPREELLMELFILEKVAMVGVHTRKGVCDGPPGLLCVQRSLILMERHCVVSRSPPVAGCLPSNKEGCNLSKQINKLYRKSVKL